MALNCDSSNGKSNVLCNNPLPSTSLKITIPSTTWHTIINNATEYERCVHGNKDRMYRVMKNEPHRIQFRPIKYSSRSRTGKAINENFSEILLDGVVNSHLTMCKCKRLIARHSQFLARMKRHLETEFHSNSCPPSLHKSKEDARLTDLHKEIGKADSGSSTNPRVSPISSSNEPVPPPRKLEPSSPQSAHQTEDFLTRKRKLERLLWIEPPIFVFMPAISLPSSIRFAREVFSEFTIPGFQTDDLTVCTSCVSILNNYPNDIWNLETHAGTYCHFQNVRYGRGI